MRDIRASPTGLGICHGVAHPLGARVGLTGRLGDHGVTADDFEALTADALDDEVMANTPRFPTAEDIHGLLAAAFHPAATVRRDL